MTKKPFRVHGVSNSLWNDDLAPIPQEERSWGALQFCSLWMGMAVCIPAYMLASGLIVLGMSWKQALGTILLGNGLVLVAVILNAHAGTKYGIPFPVYARASFGVLGAHVPAVLRALVGCGWYGIHCWIGGLALFGILNVAIPGVAGSAVWYCFAAFWLVTMGVVLPGPEGRPARVKAMRMLSAALLLVVGLALLFWMVSRVGGLGVVLASAGTSRPGAISVRGPGLTAREFWKVFVPSLTGIVGFWATVALNISDLSRYGQSQEAQRKGQAWGLPAAMMVYSFMAIAVTAGTVLLTPDHGAIWNPIDVLRSLHQPVAAVLGLLAVAVATLAYNVAWNVVGPAQAFSNLRPNLISLRMGGVLTGVLGICCVPWLLIADPERYIFGWLVGYSGVLGPIAAVMMVDYFIVRRRWLDVDSLYVRDGQYEYRGGFNMKAMTALGVGIIAALVGLFVPSLHALYGAAWFVGFAVAGGAYLVLMSGPPEVAEVPPAPLLIPLGEFEGEGA